MTATTINNQESATSLHRHESLEFASLSANDLDKIILGSYQGVCEMRLQFIEALLVMNESRLYTEFACNSVEQYVKTRVPLERSATYELLRVARAFRSLKKLRQAYLGRQLSWSQVVAITRVAAPESQTAWIDFAQEKSVRQIRDEVSHALDSGRTAPRSAEGGLLQERVRFSVELTPSQLEIMKAAIGHACNELEARDGERPKTKTAPLLFVMEQFLAGFESGSAKRSAVQIIVHTSEDSDAAWIRDEDGRKLHLEPEDFERLAKGAKKIRLEEVASKTAESASKTAETQTVTKTARRQSSRLTRAVIARDGGRCSAPCCSHAHRLQVHHIIPLSSGGPSTLNNETTVCSGCHASIHQGRLTVTGDAMNTLRWSFADGRTFTTRCGVLETPRAASAREDKERVALYSRALVVDFCIGKRRAKELIRGAMAQCPDGSESDIFLAAFRAYGGPVRR